MDNAGGATRFSALDTGLLSQMIMEMGVLRRHVCSYPADHPVIKTSLDKVMQLHNSLLHDRAEITIGIAKDSLMVGNAFLDRKNRFNQDFARVLFGHGIAALTMMSGITQRELLLFNQLISSKKEKVRDHGGVVALLQKAGVTRIQVEEISFAYFRTVGESEAEQSEQDPVQLSPWEKFVQGLLCGTLDPDGTRSKLGNELDPVALAAALNRLFADEPQSDESTCTESIKTLFHQLHRYDSQHPQRNLALDRLCLFVSQLSPRLRRLFLSGAFYSAAGDQILTEQFTGRLPEQLLFQALEDVSAGECYAPPFVLALLKKLCRSGSSPIDAAAMAQDPSMLDEQSEKLHLIFREDCLDSFVPVPYQQDLRQMLNADWIETTNSREVDGLKETLATHAIETHIGDIILEILRLSPDADRIDVLAKSLADICHYYLQIGDFTSLLKIHQETVEPLEIFSSHKFMEEVLQGLRLWGKAKYPEIQLLIQRIGTPFVMPLLDNLAEEDNMSIRRFFIDRLVELGEATKDAALARLRDTRWYFLRNILLILHRLDDPMVIRHVRPLLLHPHPKVRLESMKVLLHFGDQDADRRLLTDLESTDEATLFSAVQLAEFSRHSQIGEKLLALLKRGGLAGFDLDLKLAVVRALAEIGYDQGLPELERVLRTRSIFRPAAHLRLKTEILHSLERYPNRAGLAVLEETAAGGTGELAKLAESILKNMRGKGK